MTLKKQLLTAAAVLCCVGLPPMLAFAAADPTYVANSFSAGGDVSCYSWTGGDKSAGGFTKCRDNAPVAPAKPAPVAVAPVASTVCPPQVIVTPEPSAKAAKRKPVHRKPLPTCKP